MSTKLFSHTTMLNNEGPTLFRLLYAYQCHPGILTIGLSNDTIYRTVRSGPHPIFQEFWTGMNTGA